jgi:GNAT superfamily N-acetyltransferase
MDLSFLVVSALPRGIGELARSASSEGFGMVRRLVDDYSSGANTFSKHGECLCAVRNEDQVIAIGGINVDPYYESPSLGRIRHLYVHPDFRRNGVGAGLMGLIEGEGAKCFDSFQLFTESRAASSFYEALGYVPVEGRWKVSHAKWTGRLAT